LIIAVLLHISIQSTSTIFILLAAFARPTIFSGARTSEETDTPKYFPTQNSFKTHRGSRHLQKNVIRLLCFN
ncbi:MAG: hypothetical protein JXI43_06455, partial [Tissierellales bacterium]|nr:hypothetical protein [Tissierellales bacterium]